MTRRDVDWLETPVLTRLPEKVNRSGADARLVNCKRRPAIPGLGQAFSHKPAHFIDNVRISRAKRPALQVPYVKLALIAMAVTLDHSKRRVILRLAKIETEEVARLFETFELYQVSSCFLRTGQFPSRPLRERGAALSEDHRSIRHCCYPSFR
jgi:hypothetical protein